MNSNFKYEHIGHMQFSTLTINALMVLLEMSGNIIGDFVDWEEVQIEVIRQGFSQRQAHGELERFCYGGECREKYDNGIRKISLTKLGDQFVKNLIDKSDKQNCEVAVLLRPSRRKGFWNSVVQESTFWPKEVYEILKEYGFRNGPARDFLRSLNEDSVIELCREFMTGIDIRNDIEKKKDLSYCLEMISKYGKYWSSVGGKYSWFVFPQTYDVPWKSDEEELYDRIIEKCIRPPEWGNGGILKNDEFNQIADAEKRMKFLEVGILRPIYSDKGELLHYQLTAPGFLMWERIKKGPIIEILISRIGKTLYEVSICDGTDMVAIRQPFEKEKRNPSWLFRGNERSVSCELRKIMERFAGDAELSKGLF